MSNLRWPAILLSIVLMTIVESFGAIVVNEAMVNEPGSSTTLEWIELYNNSQSQSFLGTHYMVIGNDTVTFPSGLKMAPGEYFIVCAKLFSDLTTPGFEGVWGDSSGVWGDTPFESSLPIHFDVSFSLINGGGSIKLYNAFNFLVSDFQWTQAGADGVSWEREFVDSVYIRQCIRPSGSTPGFVNSVTPVAFDLSLEQIDISPFAGSTIVFFHIVNRSYNIISGAKLYFFRDPGDTLLTPTDTIEVFDLPDSLLPGFTTLIGGNYLLIGVYDSLLAELTDDDRLQNNRQRFIATGAAFPPIFINEFLANPTGGVGSEWVEIKNTSNVPIDLKDWQLGDALNLHTIVNSSCLIYPGEYLALVQDSTNFLNYYAPFTGLLLETDGWSALNNNGDQIRLIDAFGFSSDSLSFSSTYADNFTWALAETGFNMGVWGRSQDTGGTPGALNVVVFSSLGDEVSLTITPEHFAPDGDGIDETVQFTLEAPQADSYSLRIFDRFGREVRKLIDKDTYLSPSYDWDGRNDDGKRLPIGIYIVVFEVSGINDVKRTVVITR